MTEATKDLERERAPGAADLLEEMREKAAAEKEEILATARARAGEIEQESRARRERLERAALAEVDAELGAVRGRALGRVRSEARARRLELKRGAMDEVIADARREIDLRIKGSDYDAALRSLLREALSFVGAEASVVVAREDEAAVRRMAPLDGIAFTVEGAELERGSLIARSRDGKRAVDNGLATRLARAEAVLAADVARLLFGGEGDR